MAVSTPAGARASISGLYALTPELDDTRALVERVAAALAGGASAIQYRNKVAAPALRSEQALALRAICDARGAMFIVNDDVELARVVGADGVHLGRDDAPIAIARARLGWRAIIGASCYNSLERAEASVAAGADYIAFGSFFQSRVKPTASRAGPSLLTAAKQRWRVPVVAIGGITPDNVSPLIAAGADAIAAVGAVFDAGDVTIAARRLCAAMDAATVLHLGNI